MRTCGRPSCGNSIEHLRVDAHYCSGTCRRAAAREREAAPAFSWASYAERGQAAARRGRERYRLVETPA